MEKIGATRTQNPVSSFISSGLRSLATQAQGLIKSSPLTFISQRAPGIPNQVTAMVGGLGSRAQAAFSETAHSISKTIFGEAKPTPTDKEFRLALMDQIPPETEGVFRVSGEEGKVKQLVKDRHFEGILSPHNAATALKRSFKENPLFNNDDALKKLQDHEPPLVDADWNVIGDPKVVYDVLTKDLSPDEKETFDRFLVLTSELNKHQETSKMTYVNTAITMGVTVFARSQEKKDQNDIMMSTQKYSNRFLSSLLETLDPSRNDRIGQ